jgi:tetratricopeptide (TPR) repeat protein
MRNSNDNPSAPEILAQLDRMLSSDHFRTADTQSKLLSLAVNKALRGDSLSEYELGLELFGHYDQEITHKVRVHASNVRKKIDEFYANLGREDFVRIGLPPGRAYRPSLTYNIAAPAVHKYRQAIANLEYGSSMALFEAIEILDEVVKLAPEYAPAYALRAECILLGNLMGDAIGNVGSYFRYVSFALDDAERAVEINNKCLPGIIACGACQLLGFNWRMAGIAFDRALEIDSDELRGNLWYGAYLMTVGEVERGLGIAATQAKISPGNFMLHLVAGFFFYAAGDFGKALELFFEVNVSDERRDWRNGLVQLLFATPEIDDGPDSGRYDFDPDGKYFEQMIIDAKRYRGKRLRALEILSECTDGKGNPVEGKRMLLKWRKKIAKADLDLAVAYMAVGSHARAIVALRRAYRNENVFVNWLHLLPIFAPLRAHPRFRELTDSIAQNAQRPK